MMQPQQQPGANTVQGAIKQQLPKMATQSDGTTLPQVAKN